MSALVGILCGAAIGGALGFLVGADVLSVESLGLGVVVAGSAHATPLGVAVGTALPGAGFGAAAGALIGVLARPDDGD